jgi:hypothetical protein
MGRGVMCLVVFGCTHRVTRACPGSSNLPLYIPWAVFEYHRVTEADTMGDVRGR